jgi:hypothetical protein
MFNITVFWYVIPCTLVDRCEHFKGTYLPNYTTSHPIPHDSNLDTQSLDSHKHLLKRQKRG